jgi:hypothetical protein
VLTVANSLHLRTVKSNELREHFQPHSKTIRSGLPCSPFSKKLVICEMSSRNLRGALWPSGGFQKYGCAFCLFPMVETLESRDLRARRPGLRKTVARPKLPRGTGVPAPHLLGRAVPAGKTELNTSPDFRHAVLRVRAVGPAVQGFFVRMGFARLAMKLPL